MYKALIKGKAANFSDIDKDKLAALGIFKESVFYRDKKGYAHITFITKPHISKINTKETFERMHYKTTGHYKITGQEGYQVKVPKDEVTVQEAIAGIFKLGKPLKVEKLEETSKTVMEREIILPIYDSDAYSKLEKLC